MWNYEVEVELLNLLFYKKNNYEDYNKKIIKQIKREYCADIKKEQLYMVAWDLFKYPNKIRFSLYIKPELKLSKKEDNLLLAKLIGENIDDEMIIKILEFLEEDYIEKLERELKALKEMCYGLAKEIGHV